MKIFTSITLIISVLLSILGFNVEPDVKPLSDYNNDNTYEMSMLSVNKKGYVINEYNEKIVLDGLGVDVISIGY